jgi:hypothetical protein
VIGTVEVVRRLLLRHTAMTIVYNLPRQRRGGLKAQALFCSWLAVWHDEARVATGVKTLGPWGGCFHLRGEQYEPV